MSDLQPPCSEAPRDEKGRLRPGHTANPGGVPKWLRKVRKELAKGAPEAFEFLRATFRGETKAEMVVDGETVEVPARLSDRIAAAKAYLEYAVPKPKQEMEIRQTGESLLTGLDQAKLLEWATRDE